MYAKNLLEGAAKALKLGKGWPEDSPHKEEMASLRGCKNLSVPGMMVRKAIRPGLDDDRSEVMRSEELNTGRMAKLMESYHQAKQKDAQREQCAAGVAVTTDFLRRIIAPVRGQGGVALSYVCPHFHCLPLEDFIWCVSPKEQEEAVQQVVRGGAAVSTT